MSEKKWLVTNGIGGHCLDDQLQELNSEKHLLYLPVKFPLQTRAMIHHLHDQVRWQGNWVNIGEMIPGDDLWKYELAIIAGLPQFKFFNPFFAVEKLIFMLPGRNTLFIRYLLRDSTKAVSIRLCPSIPLEKGADSFTDWRRSRKYTKTGTAFSLEEQGDQWLYFHHEKAVQTQNTSCWLCPASDQKVDCYQPFSYEVLLKPDEPVTFSIGLEKAGNFDSEALLEQELIRRHKIRDRAAKRSGSELIASYAISATDFLVDVPTKRTRSHVALVDVYPNPEVKICSMLKCTLGLLLCLGNVEKSRQILNNIRSNAENGVLQSLTNPLQNGIAVEAGLWYINGVFTHFLVEKKQGFLAAEYPFLLSIFNAYSQGAIKGCFIDEVDGLMVVDRNTSPQNDNGMARWRIAARGEKRVEIQALFYNALCILLDIASRLEKKDGVAKLEAMHAKFHKQFLKLFWLDEDGYFVDTIENGLADKSFRSAQLLTLALPFTPLTQ